MNKIQDDLLDALAETTIDSKENIPEKVMDIPLSNLFPFKDHPFKVIKDEGFNNLVNSIRDFGVLSPAIARPKPNGGYEIISGHRRKAACELLGLEKLPVIIRDMTDDQAVIIMVDSNIQRENLLPSEKAFAFKMKLDAMKRQGRRNDLTAIKVDPKSLGLTSGQVVQKSSVEILGEQVGENYKQIQRYIRLTELIPEILQIVDERKMAFNPAVEISFLAKQEQQQLLDVIKREQSTPSLSQSRLIKTLSCEKKLTTNEINRIMAMEKGNQKNPGVLQKDTFAKFFPNSYTEKQMAEVIENLLSVWKQKQKSRREQER